MKPEVLDLRTLEQIVEASFQPVPAALIARVGRKMRSSPRIAGYHWINSASGGVNLIENWGNDLKTQWSQMSYQKLWGLVTSALAGLIDALLVLVAFVLYPVVIAIFRFFYLLYGSFCTSLARWLSL